MNSDRVRDFGMLFDSGSSSSVRSGSFCDMTGRENAVVPKHGSLRDRDGGALLVFGRGGVTIGTISEAARPLKGEPDGPSPFGVHPALLAASSRSREDVRARFAVMGRLSVPVPCMLSRDELTRFVRPVPTRDRDE